MVQCADKQIFHVFHLLCKHLLKLLKRLLQHSLLRERGCLRLYDRFLCHTMSHYSSVSDEWKACKEQNPQGTC